MISIIIPTNHIIRVKQFNALYRDIKKNSGIETQVIAACDNPEVFDLLEADLIVKVPYRVELTWSLNFAEKFALYDTLCLTDDSVTIEPGWGRIAYDEFWRKFPDGMGVMEISGMSDCASKPVTTRKFMYEINGNNFYWNEYLHCGDTENYEKCNPLGKFYALPQVLHHETKVDDASRIRNKKIWGFDDQIRAIRSEHGWPMTLIPDWRERLQKYCTGDVELEELYDNIINPGGIHNEFQK
jgi:hypothetical protein